LCDESTEQSGAKREQKAEDGRIPGHPSMGIDQSKLPIPIDAQDRKFGPKESIRRSHRFPSMAIDEEKQKVLGNESMGQSHRFPSIPIDSRRDFRFRPRKSPIRFSIKLGRLKHEGQQHTGEFRSTQQRLGFFIPSFIPEPDKLQIDIPLED